MFCYPVSAYFAYIFSRNKLQLKEVIDAIARQCREWFPGATYHLMARGIRRMEIFEDEFDFQVFLKIMQQQSVNNDCRIHAYCLMTNHFHLLVETGEVEIGQFMMHLSGKYAMYYNRHHGYSGHVFERRYKSCLVKTDDYFLQTSRYIHLNPVKARMAAHPEDYRYSSYKTIIRLQDDGITEPEKTLAYFGPKGIFGYREFVENTAHKYVVEEDGIRKVMGENDVWLPW